MSTFVECGVGKVVDEESVDFFGVALPGLQEGANSNSVVCDGWWEGSRGVAIRGETGERMGTRGQGDSVFLESLVKICMKMLWISGPNAASANFSH
jgi:hypothetical protein